MESNISTFIINDTLTSIHSFPVFSSVVSFSTTTISMSCVAVILLLFRISNKMFRKLSSVSDSAKIKRNPGVPTVPMFTVLKGFLQFGTDFPSIFETLVQKYGEIFNISLLGFYDVVFIFNPSMLQKLYLSTEPGHLHKPKWYNKVLGGSLQDGLFASRADLWKIHKGIVSKAFTYKGLLRQVNIFEEHAKHFVLNLQDSCFLSTSLNQSSTSFYKQANMVTYDIISHIAAGKELHDLRQEEKVRYQNNYNRIIELIAYRVFNPLNYMDFIWNCNPQKWEMDRRLEEISNSTDKVISAIRKNLDANTVDGSTTDDDMAGKSLVELMIKGGLTNEEIFAETMTFFAAGHDAVTTNLNILIYLLASHKEYQDECRQEIDQMFHKMWTTNSNEITMESLKSLTFFDMCIKECFRLYRSVPLFGRQLESPIQLDEGTYLPPNTIVLTSPLMIHRNHKIYPEPEKFYPKRFLPGNVENMGPCEFMPFAAGPRKCIAFKSVTLELKVLVAYVLHNFEVQSDMSIDDLNQILHKTVWPFPDLGIKICPRH